MNHVVKIKNWKITRECMYVNCGQVDRYDMVNEYIDVNVN